MSVKKEPSGKRTIQVEVEVPGTPEQVWQAIATGAGVSAWFIPAEIKPGKGGEIICHFGPGMDSKATITSWDAPHRLTAESNDLGPNNPTMATEWTVEARSGGTCVVRVVHSLFSSTDDWDDQLTGLEQGWPTFFEVLRIYLAHFNGLACSGIHLMGFPPSSGASAWETVTQKFGLTGATRGTKWKSPSDAPIASGTVEKIGGDRHHFALIRTQEPAPGVALVNVPDCGGGPAFFALSFYLYGDAGKSAAEREQPGWQEWMKRNFPAPAEGGHAA
jgi:uncharacterized protein YndB with AHSA1/START domain